MALSHRLFLLKVFKIEIFIERLEFSLSCASSTVMLIS